MRVGCATSVVLIVSFPILLVSAIVGMLSWRFLEGRSGCPGGAEWTAIMLFYGSIIAGFISLVFTAVALLVRR